MSPPTTTTNAPRPNATSNTDGAAAAQEPESGRRKTDNVPNSLSGDVDYFLSIPWCRALLRPGENLPAGSVVPTVRITQPMSRRRPRPPRNPDGTITSDPTSMNNAFTITLNSADTIGAFVVFYEEPQLPAAAHHHPAYRPPIVEVKALLRLGAGMAGHVGYAHGGLVTAILDEVLSIPIPINQARVRHNQRLGIEPPAPPDPESASTLPAEVAAFKSGYITTKYMTGYLNTSYLRPVKTMTTILVKSRFTRMEGPRKFYFEGGIWDDKNQFLAKAECVFIALKDKL